MFWHEVDGCSVASIPGSGLGRGNMVLTSPVSFWDCAYNIGQKYQMFPVFLLCAHWVTEECTQDPLPALRELKVELGEQNTF